MEQNQTQQEELKCSGDCLSCRKRPNERRDQWQYCAAQFTYNTMRMIGDMQEQMKQMQGTVDELKVKIEAIQNSESNVFDPTESSSEPISQNGDGEESRCP